MWRRKENVSSYFVRMSVTGKGKDWSSLVKHGWIQTKARLHELLNHRDSVAGTLAWIASGWATSNCMFKHSATVNWKRVCSFLHKRQQNDEILPNSNNYLFKWSIQLPRLATGCKILNKFTVNRWFLRLRNSVAAPATVRSHEWLHRWGYFSNGIVAIQLLMWTGLWHYTFPHNWVAWVLYRCLLVHSHMLLLSITLLCNIPLMRWQNNNIDWNGLMLRC